MSGHEFRQKIKLRNFPLAIVPTMWKCCVLFRFLARHMIVFSTSQDLFIYNQWSRGQPYWWVLESCQPPRVAKHTLNMFSLLQHQLEGWWG